jgi:mannosyltransferase OCH1-like enzyme
VLLPQHTDSNGFSVREVAHSADVFRLRLMRDFGGVYMDADVITVASFDPLLQVYTAYCLRPTDTSRIPPR